METTRPFPPAGAPVPSPMSTLSELTCLVLRRPGQHASEAQLAGYFDKVAALHTHLAEEARTVAERETELALAGRNRDRAERLSLATVTAPR